MASMGMMLASLSIVYYLVSSSDHKTVSLLILFTVWCLVVIYYVTQNATNATNTKMDILNDEVEQRRVQTKYIVSDQYLDTTLSKQKLKFLKYNEGLAAIAMDVLFLRKFDKSRYQDFVWNMNILQKVYMYILLKRYRVETHYMVFEELRKKVLEILYSFVMVVPVAPRRTYGVDPYKKLKTSTKSFVAVTNKMSNTLKNFATREENVQCIISSPYPANFIQDSHSLP